MAKRSMINLCVYGVPPGHVYKGWREEEAVPHRARPKCGVLLGLALVLVGFHLPHGIGKREGRRRRKEGAPPFPSPIRLVHGQGARPPLRPFSPFPYAPLMPNTDSRNSSVLRKIPESLRTFPMSEYSLPIYQFLPLDHFETPRHVSDLIWDSNQYSVTLSV